MNSNTVAGHQQEYKENDRDSISSSCSSRGDFDSDGSFLVLREGVSLDASQIKSCNLKKETEVDESVGFTLSSSTPSFLPQDSDDSGILIAENKRLKELLTDSNEKTQSYIATTEKLTKEHSEYEKKSEESREVITRLREELQFLTSQLRQASLDNDPLGPKFKTKDKIYLKELKVDVGDEELHGINDFGCGDINKGDQFIFLGMRARRPVKSATSSRQNNYDDSQESSKTKPNQTFGSCMRSRRSKIFVIFSFLASLGCVLFVVHSLNEGNKFTGRLKRNMELMQAEYHDSVNMRTEMDTTLLVTDKVWFDIKIGNETAGRIEIGLFRNIVPMTVKNFIELVKRAHGKGYKGSMFHHVTQGSHISGGSFFHQDGTFGEGIHGQSFPHENHKIRHYGSGWVSMLRVKDDSQHSHGSRFLITTTRIDLTNVVFGKVLSGMSVIRMIELIKTDQEGTPQLSVVIADCGHDEIAVPFAVAKGNAVM